MNSCLYTSVVSQLIHNMCVSMCVFPSDVFGCEVVGPKKHHVCVKDQCYPPKGENVRARKARTCTEQYV